MKNRKIGTAVILLGFILIAAAGVVTIHNINIDVKAGEKAESILDGLTVREQSSATDDEDLLEYFQNSDNEMVSVKLDGEEYIGILSIPKYGLELPVMEDWSYAGMQISPCRYSGSVYKQNLVIAAHNYYSHFGSIGGLTQGDEIYFKGMDGRTYQYAVAENEVLSPDEVDKMCNSEWELTLFTCTLGGRNRITVRCKLNNQIATNT